MNIDKAKLLNNDIETFKPFTRKRNNLKDNYCIKFTQKQKIVKFDYPLK